MSFEIPTFWTFVGTKLLASIAAKPTFKDGGANEEKKGSR